MWFHDHAPLRTGCVSFKRISLTYTFDLLNITQFHRSKSKHLATQPHGQRRYIMNVFESVTHFFNCQRMNVKKYAEGVYTLSGHNLRFFSLTQTLSRWERESKEIAVNGRSKYR